MCAFVDDKEVIMEALAKNFVPRTKFVLDRKINWFPRHMNKGIRDIGKTLKNVDCIIEVHDARIPFSGRNVNLLRRLASMKPILLLMNKADLLDKSYVTAIRKRLIDTSDPYHVPVKEIFFTNTQRSIGYNQRLLSKIFESVKGKYSTSDFMENQHYNLLVMGIPNVGKSTVINRLRNVFLHKSGKATETGNRPGVTRSVLEKIKICEHPQKLYLYDTPGIIEPPFKDMASTSEREAYLKCALCGNILENIVDIEVVADYLLYVLNRDGNFSYVEHMGCPGPSNNIIEVLTYGALKQNIMHKIKSLETGQIETVPEFNSIAERFLRMFRDGSLGQIFIDSDLLDNNKKTSPI